MYKVLLAVHPNKASMLGAEAFNIKVQKVESREARRRKFAAQNTQASNIYASSAGGSMDAIVVKNTKAENI